MEIGLPSKCVKLDAGTTSHDDDMREYILDVVEEAEHDKFRRGYA